MRQKIALGIGGFFLLWTLSLFGYAEYIQTLTQAGQKALEKQSADSIVVLTGGGNRIATGQALLEAGKAPKMFITGVGNGVRFGDILPERLRCCVTLGGVAENTVENAEEVKRWLSMGQDQRIVLVTAHYHLPRALWHFADQMPHKQWIVYAAQPDGFRLDRWYTLLLGWKILSIELTKFLVVVLI